MGSKERKTFLSQSYEMQEQGSDDHEIRSEAFDLVGDMGANGYGAQKQELRVRKLENEGLASKEGTSPSLQTEQFEMFQNSFEGPKGGGSERNPLQASDQKHAPL